MNSIEQLLNYARDYVPKEDWANTPLELKATAGLRLLPEEKSAAIINGVKQTLVDSPFIGKKSKIKFLKKNNFFKPFFIFKSEIFSYVYFQKMNKTFQFYKLFKMTKSFPFLKFF